MFVLVCSLEVTDLLSRWRHDHGANNAGAMVKAHGVGVCPQWGLFLKAFEKLPEQPLEALIIPGSLQTGGTLDKAEVKLCDPCVLTGT